MFEVAAVIVGLVVGWLTVSFVLDRIRETNLSGWLSSLDIKPDRDWPAILDVPRGASGETVRLAYERQVAKLEQSAPRVSTVQESATRGEARRRLDLALQHALDAQR